MSVRLAVIGAGVMGADHARILAQEVPGATLSVVCDASPERAAAIAGAYGASVADDPMAVITRDDVDAVLVASPDETHARLSIASIAAGKPVLCEKPLAPTPDEALSVVDAEVAAGRKLVFCGYMRRFDPPYVDMRATLRAGRVGRPLMLHNIHRNVAAPPHFTAAMAVTNSAPHEFDIARFVLDADYTAICAFQPASVDANVPGAPVVMVLETDAGQLVTVEVSVNAAYGYDVRGELVGERGTVELVNPVLTRVNADMEVAAPYPADWRPRFAEAYRLQNMAFVAFARTGELPEAAANAWDGYVATVVADAGSRALASGERTPVLLATRPSLYG